MYLLAPRNRITITHTWGKRYHSGKNETLPKTPPKKSATWTKQEKSRYELDGMLPKPVRPRSSPPPIPPHPHLLPNTPAPTQFNTPCLPSKTLSLLHHPPLNPPQPPLSSPSSRQPLPRIVYNTPKPLNHQQHNRTTTHTRHPADSPAPTLHNLSQKEPSQC